MTTVTRPITRLMPGGIARMLQLRRARGSARAIYSVIRGATSLPLLRQCVHLCVGDVYRLPLTDFVSTPKAPKSYVVRQAIVKDVPALADYFGDRQRIEERFERGDVCIMTLCQEKIGAAVWLTVGPGEYHEDWDELRYVCQVPDGIVWTYDGRGTKLGAWGTLMARLPNILRELGVTELATLIDCNNWKSLDAHASLGYEKVGVIGCAGVLGLVRSMCKPCSRGWRFLPTQLGELTIVRRRDG